MRIILLVIILSLTFLATAQRKINSTDTLKISGSIKTEFTFTISDFAKLPSKSIANIDITNQKGEVKKTAKQLKGILIKDLLDTLNFQIEKPKELNEFYFVFIASDGYKVVYSWNEIFNNEVGNTIYLVTEQDGKKIKEMEERILIVTTSDFKTGKRHIKCLEKIIVKRVD